MPLTFSARPDRCTVELTVRGNLAAQDYADAMLSISRVIDDLGPIGLIEVVESFSGFGDDVAAPPGGTPASVLAGISRVAVVSDIGWVCPILSNAPCCPTLKMQSFPMSELDKARDWVSAAIK
ncbi:STAS/SEC14 domain-containing protein [Tropicibacter sp. S64]|uniref:STAS/SEC14 domain-containing protein n=1 Tax=Tropicibacter sp. S64 TaxID=3415122 RepID=UPI003C7ED63D